MKKIQHAIIVGASLSDASSAFLFRPRAPAKLAAIEFASYLHSPRYRTAVAGTAPILVVIMHKSDIRQRLHSEPVLRTRAAATQGRRSARKGRGPIKARLSPLPSIPSPFHPLCP